MASGLIAMIAAGLMKTVRACMMRLQELAKKGVPQLGLTSLLKQVYRTDGYSGLMAGWRPSILRELSYSSIRMGLYDQVKGGGCRMQGLECILGVRRRA